MTIKILTNSTCDLGNFKNQGDLHGRPGLIYS